MSISDSDTSSESNPRNSAGSSFKKEGLVNTETRKIGLACFIGGFLGCIVALICTPAFWWLGLIAGFAGGYVSYEFRSVLQAIPKAFLQVQKEFSLDFVRACFQGTKKWFAKPHPIVYFGLCSGLLWTIIEVLFDVSPPKRLDGQLPQIDDFVALYLITFLGSGFCSGLIGVTVVLIGARDEIGFVPDDFFGGYREALNHATVGVGRVLKFVFWTASVKIVLWTIPKWVFLVIFVLGAWCWELFKIIHSDKRLLCGVDSAIGVATGYILALGQSASLVESLFFSTYAGLIGAVLGILNWELVSKRWLKVPVKVRAD
ncbi:MAG: hypothetical protein AAB534_01245 [Patescibacteria group bacterium]|mgnify:FL=1